MTVEIRKHIIEIIERAFTIAGITVVILATMAGLLGESAKGFSSIFELGNQGVPVKIVFEYFAFAFIVSISQFVLFNDFWIKKWSITPRIVCMILIQIVMVGVFAYFFRWFPVNDPVCWGMFFLSFAICFVISAVVSGWKENRDNSKLEEGLKALREQAAKKQERV